MFSVDSMCAYLLKELNHLSLLVLSSYPFILARTLFYLPYSLFWVSILILKRLFNHEALTIEGGSSASRSAQV